MTRPIRVKTISGLSVLLVLLGTSVLSGCETSLEPFDEDSGQFSIQGYMTLTGQENLIRIKDLRTSPLNTSPQPLKSTVTLVNLATGQTVALSDSVIEFNGVYTHNFRVLRPLQSGVTYRLTVERSNGQSSHAIATMPTVEGTEFSPSGTISCNEAFNLYIPSLPQDSVDRFIQASGGVFWDGQMRWAKLNDFETGRYTVATPSTIVARVVPDSLLPEGEGGLSPAERYCSELGIDSLSVAYTHYGPDWPVDSIRTDPIESSVKNGLGLLVGIRRDTIVRRVQ